MEAITVSATAAATVSFSPAEDGFITGYTSSSQWILSTDPSATVANRVTTPPANQADRSLLICGGSTLIQGLLKIPVFSREVYYVASKAANVVVFYIEPVTAP